MKFIIIYEEILLLLICDELISTNIDKYNLNILIIHSKILK